MSMVNVRKLLTFEKWNSQKEKTVGDLFLFAAWHWNDKKSTKSQHVFMLKVSKTSFFSKNDEHLKDRKLETAAS